jgi:hypothetical protein
MELVLATVPLPRIGPYTGDPPPGLSVWGLSGRA